MVKGKFGETSRLILILLFENCLSISPNESAELLFCLLEELKSLRLTGPLNPTTLFPALAESEIFLSLSHRKT